MKKLKYLNTYRDNTGTFRAYVRRVGVRSIPIPGKLGSPAFMAAYRAALTTQLPKRARQIRALDRIAPDLFAPGPHVYFLKGGGRIKIGTTTNPVKRILGIQAASPLPLSIVAVVPGNTALEREIHKRFHDHREHGEWFRYTPELRTFIATLRSKSEQRLPNALGKASDGQKKSFMDKGL